MYDYGARFYDPAAPRFWHVDPLADFNLAMNEEHYIEGDHNGGVFNSLNHASYSYCYQNPARYIDPNGKQVDVIDFVPFAGSGRDIYRGIRDGDMLTLGFGVVGMALDIGTLGAGSLLKGGIKAGVKAVAKEITEQGLEQVAKEYIKIGVRNCKKVSAESVNKLFAKSPYKIGSQVIEGITQSAEKFVRVHNSKNKIGSWVMRLSEIKGLSPKQIADKFSLPEIPTMISDVLVPKGTKIRAGTAGAIEDWGKGGGKQVELLEFIDKKLFSNTRKL